MGDWRRGFNSGVVTVLVLLALSLGVSSIARSCGPQSEPAADTANAITTMLEATRDSLAIERATIAAQKDSADRRLAELQRTNSRLGANVRTQQEALDSLKAIAAALHPDSLVLCVAALTRALDQADRVIAKQNTLMLSQQVTITEAVRGKTLAEAEAEVARQESRTWQVQATTWEATYTNHMRGTQHQWCARKCGVVIGAVATVTIGAGAIWLANSIKRD